MRCWSLGEMPHPRPAWARCAFSCRLGVNPADCYRRRGDVRWSFLRVSFPNSDGAGHGRSNRSRASRQISRPPRPWLYNGQPWARVRPAAQYIALDAGLIAPLPDYTPYDRGAPVFGRSPTDIYVGAHGISACPGA